MKRTTSIIVAALLSLTACGEAPVDDATEVQTTSVERSALESSDLFYVRNAEGLVVLEATKAFENIDFHVTLGAAEFRALDADGKVVLDWSPVDAFLDDSDPVAHEGVAMLSTPATRVEFRADEPIEFARFVLGEGEAHQHEGEVEIPEGAFVPLAAVNGRWIPPADVVNIANGQSNPYTGSPSRCSGTFLPGTREVADFLRANFVGASSYGGYACRANTANTSQLSVHASGRAIDLFVPLAGTQADNDLGDPIAHYLMMNAAELGIEFIVWDRTSWGSHRAAPKHRAYTGPHPHHDHLHIELSPASANRTGRTFPSIIQDDSPIGYLDAANCDGIAGWAQDPDLPDNPIRVYVSIGGPVFTEGAKGYWLTANERREDLCGAIGSCDHGYHMPTPHGLMDGIAREVYVYGEDISGGVNSEMTSSGRVLQCDPPQIPLSPEFAIRRHIPNPDAFAAWGFDWNDIATVDDDVLNQYTEGDKLPEVPTLKRGADPGVYVVEGNVRRHVPNPRAMKAWGLNRDLLQTAETDDLLTGAPLQQRPFIMRGSQPGAFLVVPPPPLWADQFEWNAAPKIGKGQTAQVALRVRNRGLHTWESDLLELRPSNAIAPAPVQTGQTVQLVFEFTAPQQTGRHEACFDLVHDGYPLDQKPPCLVVDVVEQPVAPDQLQPPGSDQSGVFGDRTKPGTGPRAGYPDYVTGSTGGCSAVGNAGATPHAPVVVLLGLILFGLPRRRN